MEPRELRDKVAELRKRGFALPKHPGEAARQVQELTKTANQDPGQLKRDFGFRDRTAFNPSRYGSEGSVDELEANARLTRAMRRQRTASSDASIAIPRFYDPMEYWDLSGLPWNMADEGHRHKLHKWLRLFYATHYLVPILVDIFTRFPLAGMHLECFTGDTKIITQGGVREIGDVAGTIQTILNGQARWQDAPIEQFGEQRIWELTVRQNGRLRTIRTTEGHRWFLECNKTAADRAQNGPGKRQELTTGELRAGMKLATVFPKNHVKRGTETKPSSHGIARGVVYGDGSYSKVGKSSYVDLHGEKDLQLLKYFAEPHIMTNNAREDAVRVGNMPRYFKKELPALDEARGYLYGWLAGYFAADGTVSKRGEVLLDSADLTSLEYVRDLCLGLGIHTAPIYEYTVADKKLPQGGSITDWKGYRLPLDADSLTADFFLIEEHRNRWTEISSRAPARRRGWTVVSVVETDQVEPVYCAKVEGDERFALDGYILTGNCKDKQLEDWYNELFFDKLDYENFLVSVGREVWTVGEAFSLGSFEENLGTWEREELIRPELVMIENIAPLGNQIMKLIPSESLKQLVRTKMPAQEYKQVVDNFPELIPFLMKDEPIPVSDVLLKQIAFKQNDWDGHGTPILLRALRTLIHEEKLLASQDAIAERLYSPLILAKLGAPDMGGDYGPWLPDPGQLEEFRDDLDVALSSDFRVMTYHYALDMQNVFGREQVPDLGNDFDRIERRLCQVFGVNPSLLSGGDGGQPYASSALHAEFMNQMLRTFQKYLKQHYQSRALVCAEANGHYEYEKKGQSRIPVMDDVMEYDDEGNMRITQKPRLLIPEMKMPVLDVRDEATERAFRAQLRAMGVPIPDDMLTVGFDVEFDDMLDQTAEETMKKTIAQQQTKMNTYKALKDKGLPIPPDLRAEVEGMNAPTAPPGAGGPPGGPGGAPGGMGMDGGGMGGPPPAGGGTVIAPPMPNDLAGAMGGGAPINQPIGPGPAGARPDISDSARGQMPKQP